MLNPGRIVYVIKSHFVSNLKKVRCVLFTFLPVTLVAIDDLAFDRSLCLFTAIGSYLVYFVLSDRREAADE